MPSMYIKVKDIAPIHTERAIRVRCVRVYEILESRCSKQIKSRECLVCDEEGTFIHVNMQNKEVEKYNNLFKEGKIYSLKNFLVFTQYYMYKTCDHKYMIRLNNKTQVKAIKCKGFPTNMFQLKPYQCLKDPTLVNEKLMFDVIGRLIEIHAPVDKIIGGKPAKLIDFKIADNEGNTLKCTVWDNHVAAMIPYYNADLKEPLIVVIQLCRAKVINGEVRITSSYDATKLYLNASYQEVDDFRSKISDVHSPMKSLSTATVLSQSIGISEFTSGAVSVTSVGDLLKIKEDGEFYVPAEIVGIESSFGWMYISCMSPSCNRKLRKAGEDLVCSTCDKKFKEGIARYKLIVRVMDIGLSDAPFLLWDKECSDLVGIPANLLYKKYNQVSDIPTELDSLIGMPMIFKISLKMSQMKGANPAYAVTRILRDEILISTYCSKIKDNQEKDLISIMIDEDEEEEDEPDQEASNGENEVNSPNSVQQPQMVESETEEASGVKRSLLDQFSSSNKLKKAKAVTAQGNGS
ncbi:PREDICTED: uncharacterized protein LOC109157737 [Ipomoea nil]|uniref:uncharacterized protein LOC109157737 n=1 Tax=Ipomoea nil TaxID=35883 RepID=UPI0009010ADF|nr:PREDICTED: uncharacterized protein LOC109157737 [Ipomoea nil]